jgi:methyl-accepting chemotaxis protein
MNISNLKIGGRLAAGYGLIMLLMAGLIVLGVTRLSGIGSLTDKVINQDWAEAEAANTITSLTNANARNTLELFITTDKDQAERIYQSIEANKKAISAALETFERLPMADEARPVVANLKQTRAAYVASFSKVAKLLADDQLEEANRMMRGDTLPALNILQGHIKLLMAMQKKQVENSAVVVHQTISFSRMLMLGLGLGVLLTGVAFSVWITRSITRPLREAVSVAQRVATGDLTTHIEVSSHDETGELLQALQHMNHSFAQIVAQVRSGTDTIASGSSQMAAGNLDLSTRTEQQATSLENTASSMEQLTTTVKQNADNARQANLLALSASEVAVQGGVVVSQVVDTMDSINESAKKIADIIGVIDGIAFQTNILALNAAVEAARAGEQGRGFAVVATEVRNLAQRSAGAAKEIKSLIDDSVEKVETGARLVGQAGGTMNDIVSSVKRVTAIIAEISTASEEQTLGIDQINLAIGEMDQVTKQNAALVEEAAAAAETLHDQAGTLARVVSVFKLDALRAETASHSRRALAAPQAFVAVAD